MGFAETPEELLQYGLNQTGTRHDATLTICLYLRVKGIEKDEAYDILYNWSMKQRAADMSKSSARDIINDIKRIIEFFYNPSFRIL